MQERGTGGGARPGQEGPRTQPCRVAREHRWQLRSMRCSPPPAPRHILGPAARANKIILLPRPSRGGRRGGPRGHVKATLPPCPHGPPALSPHVCHSCPRAGRARSAWAVPCPGHVTPAQAAGHGCPRNGAGRDPGDHRGCPSARGWRAGSDPVSASACTAPLLSPSPEMGCATAKGITPTPGQGPADVA